MMDYMSRLTARVKKCFSVHRLTEDSDDRKEMDYLNRLAAKVKEHFPANVVTEDLLDLKHIDFKNPDHDTTKDIVKILQSKPHLQQKLADRVDYTPSRWLLEREIEAVRARRDFHRSEDETSKAESDPPFDPKTGDCYEWARKAKLQGICFSGGGIRSATLNLGVLQGLAKLGKLKNFDYLSSVSGGGYIHEWLAGWIKREEELKRAAPSGQYKPGDGFKSVESQLVPLPSDRQHPFHPEPIRWLRRYSNYLTPQKGFFTADTWVAVAIGLRNTFLNQLTLCSGLLFFLLILDRAAELMTKLPQPCSSIFAAGLFLIASGSMAYALGNEHRRIRFLDENPDAKQVENPGTLWGEKKILLFIVVPFLLAGVAHMSLVTAAHNTYDTRRNDHVEIGSVFVALWLMVVLVALAGAAEKAYEMIHGLREKPTGRLGQAWRMLRILVNGVGMLVLVNAGLSALAGTGFYFAVRWALHSHPPDWLMSAFGPPEPWRFQVTFGPPMLLAVPFFTLVIGAGLVGRDFPDWLREWLARVRAWSLLIGVGWMILFGIALLGPSLIEWHSSYDKLLKGVKVTTVVGWIASTLGSVLAGKSNKTNGKTKEQGSKNVYLELVAKIGPYIFVLGLLVALSLAAKLTLSAVASAGSKWWYLAIDLPFVIFLLFGWRVDVNDFSLNSFYRNRLTRCYLGASNRKRNPNPLTGFDDRDTRGMQISRLSALATATPSDKIKYTGPIPIICTAINLSFGEDLAWQERKAASFAFTPFYSGYHVGWTAGKAGDQLSYNGFVPTAHYGVPDGGINVATAVSISGAAASPNWGYHTNPATAFLMTMFNVRLGWWLFNPRRAKNAGADWQNVTAPPEWSSPRFAPLELSKELFGMADDTSRYVYLSDGGHFDNMGLYELVRRRCYRIVICDMEQDETYHFEGIANAIRKCRIDFGVEITLDLTKLRPLGAAPCSLAHWARGTIRYPETPPNQPGQDPQEGKILYIKSSLTGARYFQGTAISNEPVDIVNYRFTHEHFPHDSTANQWFTESQFESYRRLGYHVIEEIEKYREWAAF